MSALWQWDQLLINGEMPLANEIKKQQENFSATVRMSGLDVYESKQGLDYFVTLLLLKLYRARECLQSGFHPSTIVLGRKM